VVGVREDGRITDLRTLNLGFGTYLLRRIVKRIGKEKGILLSRRHDQILGCAPVSCTPLCTPQFLQWILNNFKRKNGRGERI